MEQLSPALARIRARESAVMAAEASLLAAVRDARERGETWRSIGVLWGISPQAAQQRYANFTDNYACVNGEPAPWDQLSFLDVR